MRLPMSTARLVPSRNGGIDRRAQARMAEAARLRHRTWSRVSMRLLAVAIWTLVPVGLWQGLRLLVRRHQRGTGVSPANRRRLAIGGLLGACCWVCHGPKAQRS